MTHRENLPIEDIVPGGIRPSDYVHIVVNDRTCSRCRLPVPEDDVPLMLWSEKGADMCLLIYCESCLEERQ
jgi:hypothetical protein